MCLQTRSHMRLMHRQRKADDGINWKRVEALISDLTGHCNRRDIKGLKSALGNAIYALLKPWHAYLVSRSR